MSRSDDLKKLVNEMKPQLQPGEYVFTSCSNTQGIREIDIMGKIIEPEGVSLIIKKELADTLGMPYDFIASWIVLTVNSSLHAVGFTAIFATELAKYNVGCNVVAGYYHDHIFVDKSHAQRALKILRAMSK